MEFSRSKKLKRFCTNWGENLKIPNDIVIPQFKRRAKPLPKRGGFKEYEKFQEWHNKIKKKYTPVKKEEFIVEKFIE